MMRVIAAGFAVYIIVLAAISVLIGIVGFAARDRDIIERIGFLFLSLIGVIMFYSAANVIIKADQVDVEEQKLWRK